MATQEKRTEKTSENKRTSNSEYLVRKYGKEPRITEEEMKESQWNWH